ncbi:hypothetical protein ABZ345_37685 [Lentzea sp. NPDC005914]|uniref:hypothetical protein n=1 Tax=Lentzea sp. NPDC005914 TaxID=3154572 RepID=UPI0034005E02
MTVGLTVLASVDTPTSGTAAVSAPVAYVDTAPVTAPPMGEVAAARTAAVRGGATRTGPPPATTSERFWELQLNLCNSGLPGVGCYSHGLSIIEGGDLIYALRPNLVTLNEICADDLPEYLMPSLAEAWPEDWVYYVFMPAIARDSGQPIKCSNQQDYGSAVLGRVPAAGYRGVNGWGGRYTTQDSSNEQRTFACAYAIGDHLGCATHLSAKSEPVALAQCRALLFDAVPHIRSVEGVSGKTVVGGDFNLQYDTSDPENVQNCVPSGHVRKGDGDVQHVVFSNDIAFVSTTKYGLTYTDHDGFLVRLTKP